MRLHEGVERTLAGATCLAMVRGTFGRNRQGG
jgi:hypothetical protein